MFMALAACAAVTIPINADDASTQYSPIEVFTVDKKIVPEWSEYHGVVDASNVVELIALVSGRIKTVSVKAGQQVHAGDVLIELESDELQAKLRAAESTLSAAEAHLAEAKVELDRIQELVKIKEATEQQLDKSIAAWKGAQAAVGIAKAEMEQSRTLLDYTVLKSPMDGIVVDKRVSPGDFVIPGLPAKLGYPAGRILMTVYDPNSLWFEAKIPERYSREVAVGSTAKVSIASANLTLESKFIEVLPAVDEVTRTFIARVDLPRSPALKLGMFGRASFISGQRNVVSVPDSALVQRSQLDAVFVLSDGRARLRMVRSGKQGAGNVEILSGLQKGERVILNPRETLRDGDQVAIGSTQP